ncbi:MAG: DUF5009 domain-containing protein [Pirellulales bacterium]
MYRHDQPDIDERLVSLDAYRGFIMLAMASAGFALPQVAKHFPDQPAWKFLGYQFDHVQWVGCSFWDLIQPSFMFMVGAAMAYSFARRSAEGHSFGRMLGHALYRSAVLILLGIFLSSAGHQRTDFTFVNVLTQIGLGYTFLFLLWWLGHAAWQLLAIAVILGGYWCLFYFHPAPPADFNYMSVGVPADFPHPAGIEAHWDKNTNAAAPVDRWLLNQFPREKPFEYNAGGYQTLNFIPSLATMIFGLLAGGILRVPRGRGFKLGLLVASGAVLAAGGWLLNYYGLCPLVKRIWTPSWALYSSGLTFLMLAGFYLVVDIIGLRRVAWPLAVVGMNSILMYCMAQLIGGGKGWIARSIETHFGAGVFTGYGRLDPVYEPIVRLAVVLFVMWLVCVWLYRQRIFVKI